MSSQHCGMEPLAAAERCDAGGFRAPRRRAGQLREENSPCRRASEANLRRELIASAAGRVRRRAVQRSDFSEALGGSRRFSVEPSPWFVRCGRLSG